MPTGYTADVQEGKITELRPFAMKCARAMGALVTMRDEQWDAPIPEKLEPSLSYHDDALQEANAKMKRLASMSPDECEKAALDEYTHEMAVWQKMKDDRLRSKERYEGMLAKVEAWNPPQILTRLKDFMMRQLRESIVFDCNDAYYCKPALKTGRAWFESNSDQYARDIEHHSKERANEIRRTEERNLWIAALIASL